MRLALAVCALMLLAPAAAPAREPVISYIDQDGVFRLYDAETGSDVNPPPPVPRFPLFMRLGMSQNGRYIVFDDNEKKLHLLDRATNTEVPLPGIDVYASNADHPANLTVSDTGLIGFDNDNSGPALVYDSATGQFVDTGLAADNGHRQTRLSGDGKFLATTCVATCIVDSGGDSDAYVQDLSSKSDTAFPDASPSDEDYPCLDGDGSVLGFDSPTAPPIVTTRDIRLFDRSQSPPVPITISGANTVGDEVGCILDEGGEYLGFFETGAAAFRLFHITDQTFVSLPLDRPFDERSQLSAPYAAPAPAGGGPAGGPGGGPPADAKPVVSRFRMAHRRFRVGRRATSFRFNLSEPARGRIVIRRLGRKVGEIRRRRLRTGANTISFAGKLGRRKLRPGTYAAVLIVTDLAGNRSLPVLIEFRVLRPKHRRH